MRWRGVRRSPVARRATRVRFCWPASALIGRADRDPVVEVQSPRPLRCSIGSPADADTLGALAGEDAPGRPRQGASESSLRGEQGATGRGHRAATAPQGGWRPDQGRRSISSARTSAGRWKSTARPSARTRAPSTAARPAASRARRRPRRSRSPGRAPAELGVAALPSRRRGTAAPLGQVGSAWSAAESSARRGERRGTAPPPADRGAPSRRGRGQVAADGPAGRVVLEPAGQPRPRGQQGLVGHVEPVAVDGQQTPADEDLDTARRTRRSPSRSSSARGTGRRTAPRPSSVSASRTSSRRARSAPARPGLPGGLRRARQGTRDAARLEIAGQGELVSRRCSQVPTSAIDSSGARPVGRATSATTASTSSSSTRGRPSRPARGRRPQLRLGERRTRTTRHRAAPRRPRARRADHVIAAQHDDAARDDAVVEQAEDGVEEGGPLGSLHLRCPELLELVADQQDRSREVPSPVSIASASTGRRRA